MLACLSVTFQSKLDTKRLNVFKVHRRRSGHLNVNIETIHSKLALNMHKPTGGTLTLLIPSP